MGAPKQCWYSNSKSDIIVTSFVWGYGRAQKPCKNLAQGDCESLLCVGLWVMWLSPFYELWRICLCLFSLQKELTFTVCLQYKYTNLDEEVHERQTVTVGKPLVSKLNLHEPRLPRSYSASSSFDLHSFSHSSSFPEGFGPSFPASETSSIGSASTTWSYYSQPGLSATPSSPGKLNLPVEDDSPELFDSDAPQPLTTSKSLPHGQVEDLTYRFSNMHNFHSC